MKLKNLVLDFDKKYNKIHNGRVYGLLHNPVLNLGIDEINF